MNVAANEPHKEIRKEGNKETQSAPVSSDVRLSGRFQEIQLDLIDAPKDTLRPISGEMVEELQLSIKNDGLYSPIIVRPKAEGRFEVVAGNHRFQAIKQEYQKRHENELNTYSRKLYGKSTAPKIPCLVREINEEEAKLVSVAENIQRNNYFDSVKQGQIFSEAVHNGWTIEQIQEKIGKKRIDYITNRTIIYEKLHSSLQRRVTVSQLPIKIAVTLAGYPLKEQMIEFKKLQSKYSHVDDGCRHACKIHCPKPKGRQK